MLNLYRRHQSPCRFPTRRYRNCKCPLWAQGSLRGEYIRRSLDLRSWEAATDLIRDWEAAGEVAEVIKIVGACNRYPGNRDRMRAFVLVMRYSGLGPFVWTKSADEILASIARFAQRTVDARAAQPMSRT